MKPLKPEEVSEKCKMVADGIAEHDVSHDLVPLLRAMTTIESLRVARRRDASLFAPHHVEELRALVPELHRRLVANADDLATKYASLVSYRSTLDDACEAYRSALVEVSKCNGADKILFGNGAVRATKMVQVLLPPKDSPARSRLVTFLKDSGTWERVTTISGPLLKSAIDSNAFKEEDLNVLKSLCTIGPSYRLWARVTPSRVREEMMGEIARGGVYTPAEVEALVDDAVSASSEVVEDEVESRLEQMFEEMEESADYMEGLAAEKDSDTWD